MSRVRVLGLGALLAGVLALTPLRPLKVTGRSMEPTLREGQTYVLDQFYWKSGGLRRGDIIVVRHDREKWVKRLIGMPGDRLQILYRTPAMQWIARIDNLTVDRSLERRGYNVEHRDVQPGEIFVIGDNLNWSADSTNQEAGAFRFSDVLGVVRHFTFSRVFPFPRR